MLHFKAFIQQAKGYSCICFAILPILLSSCRLNDNSIRGHIKNNPSMSLVDPEALSVVETTDSSVNLSWSGTEGLLYRLSYQIGLTAPADCLSGTVVDETQIVGQTHTIEGLQDNQWYSFRICAVSPTDTSQISSGVTVKTQTHAYCTLPGKLTNSPYANSGESNIDGTSEQKAFRICTATQMNAIGASSGDWDKYFILKLDVDLKEFGGTLYNIIGNSTTPFSGVFDGSYKVLSNFEYKDSAIDEGGLFGVTSSSAKIVNLGLKNFYIYGNSKLGGIVGFNQGLVKNCFAQGRISLRDVTAGGLVGSNAGSISTSYANVEVYGDLSSASYMGGLVGVQTAGASPIENSYAIGRVVGKVGFTTEYIGGMVGYDDATGSEIVNNSYALVDVEGGQGFGHTGGIVGSVSGSGSIRNTLYLGDIKGDGDTPGGVGLIGPGVTLVANSYYSSASTCTNVGTTGTCLDQGDGTHPTHYFFDPSHPPFNTWDFEGESVNGTENIWKISSVTGLPILSWQKEEPLPSYCWENARFVNAPYANSGEPGVDGLSESTAFTICRPKQMDELSNQLADWTKYFVLESDLDLANAEFVNGIGNAATPFQGSLDGQGHVLSYLSVPSPGSMNHGLLGVLDAPGVLKNIRLKEPYDGISGSNWGTLVGQMKGGIVEKVSVTELGAIVSGKSNVGGLIGLKSGGILRDCYLVSSLLAPPNSKPSGGLVGLHSGGSISRCYTDIGLHNTFPNAAPSGGLVGNNQATVENSFFVGSVFGKDAGDNISSTFGLNTGSISNIFFLENSCTNIDVGNCTDYGTSAASIDEFYNPTNTPMNTWDFTNVWQAVPDGLPVLRSPP